MPGFGDDQECLQVQRWSAEQLGKATDEEPWEASLCVVLKVHQFLQQRQLDKVCVFFKKDVQSILTPSSVALIGRQESLGWCG